MRTSLVHVVSALALLSACDDDEVSLDAALDGGFDAASDAATADTSEDVAIADASEDAALEDAQVDATPLPCIGAECEAPGPCKGVTSCGVGLCVPDDASFRCACPTGYHLATDSKACLDDDECALRNAGCIGRCVNDPGAFHCACESGQVVAPFSLSCRVPSWQPVVTLSEVAQHRSISLAYNASGRAVLAWSTAIRPLALDEAGELRVRSYRGFEWSDEQLVQRIDPGQLRVSASLDAAGQATLIGQSVGPLVNDTRRTALWAAREADRWLPRQLDDRATSYHVVERASSPLVIWPHGSGRGFVSATQRADGSWRMGFLLESNARSSSWRSVSEEVSLGLLQYTTSINSYPHCPCPPAFTRTTMTVQRLVAGVWAPSLTLGEVWAPRPNALVVDGDGVAHVFWTSDANTSHTRFAADGAMLGSEDLFAGSGGISTGPYGPNFTATAQGQRVAAAWSYGGAGPHGLHSWTAQHGLRRGTHPIPADQLAASSPPSLHGLALDEHGGLLAVWSTHAGQLFASRSTDLGLSWLAPFQLNEELGLGFVTLASEPGGRAIVLWEQSSEYLYGKLQARAFD